MINVWLLIVCLARGAEHFLTEIKYFAEHKIRKKAAYQNVKSFLRVMRCDEIYSFVKCRGGQLGSACCYFCIEKLSKNCRIVEVFWDCTPCVILVNLTYLSLSISTTISKDKSTTPLCQIEVKLEWQLESFYEFHYYTVLSSVLVIFFSNFSKVEKRKSTMTRNLNAITIRLHWIISFALTPSNTDCLMQSAWNAIHWISTSVVSPLLFWGYLAKDSDLFIRRKHSWKLKHSGLAPLFNYCHADRFDFDTLLWDFAAHKALEENRGTRRQTFKFCLHRKYVSKPNMQSRFRLQDLRLPQSIL